MCVGCLVVALYSPYASTASWPPNDQPLFRLSPQTSPPLPPVSPGGSAVPDSTDSKESESYASWTMRSFYMLKRCAMPLPSSARGWAFGPLYLRLKSLYPFLVFLFFIFFSSSKINHYSTNSQHISLGSISAYNHD